MALEPETATLRSYHVGFGDCFLLTFGYGGGEKKHVLIDFGTTQNPENKSDILQEAAANILEFTGRRLTAVVATHRHKDHIEGFRTSNAGDGPGDLIRQCEPDLVIQPWTEDPDLETDATAPPDHKQFRLAMRDLEDVSRAIYRDAKHFAEPGFADQLSFLGENNLANVKAVRNLQTMGKKAESSSSAPSTPTSSSARAGAAPRSRTRSTGPPACPSAPSCSTRSAPP